MYLNVTRCAALALGCFMSVAALAKNEKPAVGRTFHKPLLFVENNGQVTDNNNTVRSDIQYQLVSSGLTVYIGNGQLHYQFRKLTGAATPTLSTYRMDVELVGANPSAIAIPTGQNPYYEVYYTGQQDGITAQSFNKITYKDVYPGIDWVLYIKDNNVEYDFVLAPGADPSLIKIRYNGATKLKVTKAGELQATTPFGTIRERKLYAFETATGKHIPAQFQLQGNLLSFSTAAYTGSLTIDPSINWSTYLGSTAEDVVTGVATNAAQDVYAVGYTASNAGFATAGSFDNTFNGGAYDAFIARYSSAGALTWCTYFGGAGTDRATSIAMESTGNNFYVAGTTTSAGTGLTTAGAFHTTNNGGTEGFLLRFTIAGARSWCTFYGGTGTDVINDVAVDGSNNAIITGSTTSGTLISTAGAFKTTISGSQDAFVAKFAPAAAGAVTFSSYFGGTGTDEGQGIAADNLGNIAFTGQTTSITGIATAGAHSSTLSGTNDAFVAQMNSAGNAINWGTYLGGTGIETGNDIVCTPTTRTIAVIGNTTSTSGIATANAHQSTYGGGTQDAFVTYMTNGGTVLWSSYYGGSDIDFGEAISLDPAPTYNLVIGGGTFSTNGIATAGNYQPTLAGNYDAFVGKLNVLGQRMWGTYFGGSLYDYAFSTTCDAVGQITIGGHTTSTTGIAGAVAADNTFNGGTYDGFVTRFNRDVFAYFPQPYNDTLLCVGGTANILVGVGASAPFTAGNTFTIQLSDASGSFATPVSIGTIAGTTTSLVSCTIPAGTTPGTGYRIRIVASNPSYTSPDCFRNITIVNTLPSVTITANTPVCVGRTLNFSATAPYSISGYSWAGPGGFTSFLSAPSIASATLANEGTYSLTTTHNGCPATTTTIDVDVNDIIPVAPVANTSALNCVGGSIFLYADTATGAITGTYAWSGPASYSSTSQNPVINPISTANAGVYTVTNTVDGCTSPASTISVAVTPNTATSVSITASPNDTVCGGTLVTFSAMAINGGVSPTYQWMIGSSPIVGAIASTWSSSTLTDGNQVSCLMNSNAACPLPATATSNTIRMNVITNEPTAHIFALPGTSVALHDSVQLFSVVYNLGTGGTYQWQKNGVDIIGATNSSYTVHNVTVFDTFTLVITSTMDCASTNIAVSNPLIIHPNTAVSDIAAKLANVSIFPNPNNGTFSLKGNLSGISTSVDIAVLNPIGQVISNFSTKALNDKLDTIVTTEHLSSGVYLLQLNAEGVQHTIRFVVQK